MASIEISCRLRRVILLAIEKAIPIAERPNKPRIAPRYPDSVPEIDQHIDDLVEFIRATGNGHESPAAQIRAGICDRCPHQFPNRYCPLHQSGGCVPFRFAEQIAEAVTGALDNEI
jgi:hypothetical protein